MTQKIVLASGNKGKVAELSQMLAPFQYQIVPQTELGVSDADETGLTFIENALIKARHAALVTGLPAIADDSGLAVDILGGAPGIYSARYAGEAATDSDNIDKLLSAMQQVPQGQRGAQFHCVLVYLRHAEDPTPLVCHGVWRGDISLTRSGDNGFGYDPIFTPEGTDKTFAEMSQEEKNGISHRARALEKMMTYLKRIG